MKELDERDLVRTLNEAAFGPERERPGRGGVKHVGASDMGELGGCWCGRPMSHDWPGRDEGAPHPRYPE